MVPMIYDHDLHGRIREHLNILSRLEGFHHVVTLFAREIHLRHIKPVVVVEFLLLVLRIFFTLE